MRWSDRLRDRLATERQRLRWSIRVRITVTTLLVGMLAVGALGAVSLVVLVHASNDSTSRVLVDRLATLQSRVSVARGVVHVQERNDNVFDTTTWVFDRTGHVVDGTPIPTGIAEPLARLARTAVPVEEFVRRYRVRAEPVLGGAAVVVVALDLHPYLSSLRDATAVTIGFGLLSVAVLAVAASTATKRALRPVAQMARTAERWDRGRLADRFGAAGPTDELTELAAVLDRLLDRVATTIAGEERLTAELAHELRTPLTVIDGEAQLALRDPAHAAPRLQRIRAASERMTETVHLLLDAARGTALDDHEPHDVDDIIAAALATQLHQPGLVVTHVRSPRPVRTSAPPRVLDRVLAPLLENGARYAATRLTVTTIDRGGAARIDVANDGAPIDGDVAGRIFEPGVRSADSPGAGLGLPLAVRLAASIGGRVVLADLDPATFRVEVPAVD